MSVTDLERLEAQLAEFRRLLSRESFAKLTYSKKEAAQRLGVSARTLSRMVAANEISTVLIHGVQRVPDSELIRIATPALVRNEPVKNARRLRLAEEIKKLATLKKKRR